MSSEIPPEVMAVLKEEFDCGPEYLTFINQDSSGDFAELISQLVRMRTDKYLEVWSKVVLLNEREPWQIYVHNAEDDNPEPAFVLVQSPNLHDMWLVWADV